jgi:hypothetical protein
VDNSSETTGKIPVDNLTPITDFRDAWMEELACRGVVFPARTDGTVHAEKYESGKFYFEPKTNTMIQLLREKNITNLDANTNDN